MPNQNPSLLAITADCDGTPIDLSGVSGPATVGAGASVHLVATWSPESAESYVTIDVMRQSLDERAEKLWVSWFSTAGGFEQDVSTTGDGAAATENVWHAPAFSGTFYLWVVLHDDRGGVDSAEISVVVP
jgi:hypothetical protein